jgi:PAS domain S-box-containing protein
LVATLSQLSGGGLPSRNGDWDFGRVLAKLPVGAHACNAEGLIVYFNEKAVQLWGREPKLNDPADRFCGSLRLFSTGGAPLPHHECWMARALQHRRAYSGIEILIERPDGSRWLALAYATPFFDDRGELVGAVNILVDISNRRQSELARAHLAAIVDSFSDAIISKNLDGVVQSWNVAAERLFGYTAAQAVGRHVSFLIPADRADEEDHILARLRAGERIDHFDTVRVRSDGQSFPVSLTISPIRDDAGRIIGASKIARDISDRQRAEEKIYSLLTRLKDVDRRKDEFLATLAHELRGPLAPLGAMVEIMKHGSATGDMLQQARDTMERQLSQIVRLVDDLLDVSRIASDKLELRKEWIELATVIRQAVEACRPIAECARHQLFVDLPPPAIYLHADPARLAQVFGNLLHNACKYTDEGGTIRLLAKQQDGWVVVKVKDTGIGIPADKLAGVFDMFAQLESPSERSRGGLGIGLTVVKPLVELHGGSVRATSEGVGRGSEFIVRLPALAHEPLDCKPPPWTEGARTTKACRVLVVDDNRDSAASLALLLKLSGHETETAHDGLAALEAVKTFRPDVVLLDIGLPKLDGHEVARRIRQQPGGKDVVLVALTAWCQDEDRRKSKEAGFDQHMTKPLDYEGLINWLGSL